MERAKDYLLTFEKRPHYLSVTLRTEYIDHLTVLDYLGEIAVTAAKWHSRALLIERDIPMVLTDEEMLDSWGVFLNTRTEMSVALVNPHKRIAEAIKQLITSADGSAVNAAYFDSVAAAQTWLGK